jgi:hypothetical protein
VIAQPQSGTIMELGADAKVRWQLAGLSNPMDMQVLPGSRVLVTESGASRVTERNLKNEIVWQKQVNWPLSAERMRNGHTFIVSRNQLLEVDRSGKELFTLNRNMNDIMAARKLRDGQIVMVTQSSCVRLDSGGKELKNYPLVNGVGTNYIDILPNGSIILPMPWNNKIYEYDPDGKVSWEATAQQPMGGARMPNGNTLIPTQMWPPKIVELDKAGKMVWEFQTATYPGRVKRR